MIQCIYFVNYNSDRFFGFSTILILFSPCYFIILINICMIKKYLIIILEEIFLQTFSNIILYLINNYYYKNHNAYGLCILFLCFLKFHVYFLSINIPYDTTNGTRALKGYHGCPWVYYLVLLLLS